MIPPDEAPLPDPGRVRDPLRVLYGDLDAAVARFGPSCELSGRCCRFAEYDHTLFVSAPEMAVLLADAPPPSRPLDDGETCPWQDLKGRCTAREARPLGCRVYYCDPTYQDHAHALSEAFLGRMKRLVDDLELPWNYAPLHHHLRQAEAEGRFPPPRATSRGGAGPAAFRGPTCLILEDTPIDPHQRKVTLREPLVAGVGRRAGYFGLTLLQATNTVEPIDVRNGPDRALRETAIVTKKEIVRKISEDIGLTQLKTKDIVQRTLDAIIATLVSEGRIELRNFGVFEVKRRAPRKARNPRTGDKVYVPSKNVVTFKPGKEMEELVRKMNPENLPLLDDGSDADVESNGPVGPVAEPRSSSPAGGDDAD